MRSGSVSVSTNPLVQLGIMGFVNLQLRVITGQCSSCVLHNGSFSSYCLVVLQSFQVRVNENEQQIIQCRVFRYGKDIYKLICDSTFLLVGFAVARKTKHLSWYYFCLSDFNINCSVNASVISLLCIIYEMIKLKKPHRGPKVMLDASFLYSLCLFTCILPIVE